MEWSGVAIAEKIAIKFHRYYATLTMILTSIALVGVGHLRMTSIFVGSILISPPTITYPKYTNGY
jgi:hypothetical protein